MKVFCDVIHKDLKTEDNRNTFMIKTRRLLSIIIFVFVMLTFINNDVDADRAMLTLEEKSEDFQFLYDILSENYIYFLK